jgi:hypothetical protein
MSTGLEPAPGSVKANAPSAVPAAPGSSRARCASSPPISTESVASQCAVTIDAVEPHAPAIVATASNSTLAGIPLPPCSCGRLSPMIPISARAGR